MSPPYPLHRRGGTTAAAMRADLTQLADRWQGLCRALEVPPGECDVFDKLRAAYTAPDRYYHGIDHIDECLRELDAHRDQATNPLAVEVAIWFHDVVYDGRRTDNEERSADLADAELSRMGVGEPLRAEVRRLILLTRHNQPPAADDADGRLMVDIDLASLARPPAVFDDNTRLIRREYPHVADADFRRGRRDMLGRFLARERIYYTAAMFARYEQPARENLRRALANL